VRGSKGHSRLTETHMTYLLELLQWALLVPLTLLPIINPLGVAPIFVAMTGPDGEQSRRMARQIGINTWIIITVSMLVGTYVLALFGISLPIVRLGGGLLVAATGWKLLDSGGHDEVRNAVADSAGPLSEQEMKQRSFFPMSFPLTTGPGSIAASIALGTKIPSTPGLFLIGVAVAACGAAVTAAVVYLSYRYAPPLLRRMGEIGTMVMMRLAAFILLCIGIEMMWTGWADLNGVPH
jgi:multiple antibiotic resistance protein